MLALHAAAGIAALASGLGGIAFLIAADRTRYLTRFDLTHWNDRVYLAMLPNFLQQLHDAGLSPWPRRINAVSASVFKWRVRRILKSRPALVRRQFVRQHLNLQALLFVLKPFIDDAILAEKQKIATARVVAMADNADRDRIVRFVSAAREHRIAFANQLTSLDRRVLREMRERDFLGVLRSANAMFHEHGYEFLPELDLLRRWETLEGSELAQELPRLGKPKSAGRFTDRLGLIPAPRDAQA